MARNQLIILPRLNDRGGELNKKWYVEYSVRDPKTLKMVRFRDSHGLTGNIPAEERYANGEKLVAMYKAKLAEGWSPLDAEKVSYTDQLIYKKFAERWGSDRLEVITIRKHLSDYLDYKRAEIIQHSYQTYQSKLRIFNEWAEHAGIDSLHITAITREHIVEFMHYMVEHNNISRRTAKKYQQILHGFFEYMIQIHHVDMRNPVHNLPKVGYLTDEAARPIPDEIRRPLLAAIKQKDPQLWLVCLMEYYCAIRPNELRQLRIRDIDLEYGTIRVPNTISKNRLSEVVNMPRQLQNILIMLCLDRYEKDCYLFGKEGKPGKEMLGKNSMRFRFDKIRNGMGISAEYKLYSFKHTGGVKLVNAGIDTWELMRHFRHKSIDTTEQYIRRNFAPKSDTIKNHFPDIDA